MKNYFVFIIALLLISCNSDDDASVPLSINQSGALTKVETFYPTLDYNVNSNFTYDLNGRISSAVSTSIQPGFPNTINTVNYLFNSEGQVWKQVLPNDVFEYQFSNGLIIRTNFSGGYQEHTYNNLNQLIKTEGFSDSDMLGSVVSYTYDANGNVLTRSLNTISTGNTQSYAFEYDTNHNPQYAVYTNQEFSKILETSHNNKTKRTYNNNGTVTVFTAEYTYNAEGYPVTKTEFQDATTLVEETTFTYQP